MAGRLSPMSYRDFTGILKRNGYKLDRCKGGHETWERKESISIPNHSDINGGIARRLIKEHNLSV